MYSRMTLFDWSILIALLTPLVLFGLWTSRYMKCVADFLAANRSAGRYLLSLALTMANFGDIAILAFAQMHYKAGFSPAWWRLALAPVMVLIAVSGWIYYRFRETRCLTVQQFIEMRYSRPLRVYTGIIVFICGIVNFGIFPAVAANFFVYYCELPSHVIMGGVTVSTFMLALILTLGIAVAFTCVGGHITVMVTSCVQGIFSFGALLVISIFLLVKFPIAEMSQAFQIASPDGSMLNPLKTQNATDYDMWFYLIYIYRAFYMYMSWQGGHAYRSSGLNPHEQKMGNVLCEWRLLPLNVFYVLLPVAMLVFLSLPQYSAQIVPVNEVLNTIGNEQVRDQMTVPMALCYSLPIGFRGLFCVLMLFAMITTQDTYLHSWGTIFVQDIVMPLRKKPFEPKQHLRFLRWSVVSVALFSFFFSIFFNQTEDIFMFFAITGAIVAGSGAIMIGGLYWRRGTTAGAWVAITLGWVLSLARIVVQREQIALYVKSMCDRGAIWRFLDRVNETNSQWVMFYITVICIGSYVLVSLLTSRKPFNLEKMLHRGKYDVTGEHVKTGERKSLWDKLTGFTDEFTPTDRFLVIGLLVWNFAWLAVFAVGTAYGAVYDVSNEAWASFWEVWIIAHLVIGIPTTIWFMIGSLIDIRDLFARLKTLVRDDRDDGTVYTEPETE